MGWLNSNHADDRLGNRVTAAGEETVDQAERLAEGFAERHDVGSYGVLVARADTNVRDGNRNDPRTSKGSCTVAIVRNGRVVTYMFVRVNQFNASHLRVDQTVELA